MSRYPECPKHCGGEDCCCCGIWLERQADNRAAQDCDPYEEDFRAEDDFYYDQEYEDDQWDEDEDFVGCEDFGEMNDGIGEE